MYRKSLLLIVALALLFTLAPVSRTANAQPYNDDDYAWYDRVKVDRYLDVEIWTNHSDGEYYIGDKISIYFRVNSDAFVAIYSIDTEGRVNMLFPSRPGQDNFVYGGVTNRLPAEGADHDLVVTGPEGVENIQVIASREQFPIPDWYGVSGLVCDWEDRFDFMDHLNRKYFVAYDGQRFAWDRTAAYVNEWEEVYFRPVYYPTYPSWVACGNVYVDYPIGGSVYVNGVYWGCAPLYIPRVYVGWHTVTVYDRWGYCWESDVHITRYNTLVLDHYTIRTSPANTSKYKEVRSVGYRDPVSNGYPDYNAKYEKVTKHTTTVTKKGNRTIVTGRDAKSYTAQPSKDNYKILNTTKKHARGNTEVVKSGRGYQSAGLNTDGTSVYSGGRSGYKASGSRSGGYKANTPRSGYDRSTKSRGSYRVDDYGSRGSAKGSSNTYDKGRSGKSTSGGYYRKKTGGSKSSGRSGGYKARTPSSSQKSSGSYKRTPSSKGSSKSSGGSSYRKSTGSSSKSSGSSYRKSSGGSSKSKGSSSSGGKSKSSSSGGKKKR